MKKDKILISINNLEDIEKYKKIGINNFLFSIKDFSMGYKLFDISEIKYLECNIYLLLNRILSTKDVDKIKTKINSFDFVKGILFEDTSIYQIFKDSNIELYWNQSHFATNYSSINYWLEYVNSAVISNELTFEEVDTILKKTSKPLILNIFGKNNIMYSRRTLLTNFNDYFNLKKEKEVILKESHTNNEFLALENDKGTMLFNNTPFNLMTYIDKFNDDNILFYFINTLDYNYEDIIKVLDKDFKEADDGFMNKKTIYKLGDKND